MESDPLKIKQQCTKNEKIFLITSVLASRAHLRRVIYGLSRDELEALEMVLENGDSIKHHIFCKKTVMITPYGRGRRPQECDRTAQVMGDCL